MNHENPPLYFARNTIIFLYKTGRLKVFSDGL